MHLLQFGQLIFVLPGMLLALWAQMKLRSAYARFSEIGTERGITGAEAARFILDRNGLGQVRIEEVAGELSDHYDPATHTVHLSTHNYHSTSLAAVGVAAHEVGHALQHQQAYGPLGFRMALVPVTNFASGAAFFIIMAGMFLAGAMHALAVNLVWAGVGLFSIVTLFQLVTLPVEYDASARAKVQLARLGIVTEREGDGVREVLSAAALTYVAAMLTAMLQLLYWVGVARGIDRDER